MKKALTLILASALVISLLAACAGGAGGTSAFATIGEAMASEEAEELQYGAANGTFVYAYRMDGVYYRLIAPMTEKEYNDYLGLDFADPKFEANRDAILASLKVERCENLSEKMPSEDDLKKYVGKTGGDLLDEGWTTGSFDSYEAKIWMYYELFSYIVVFDGEIEYSDDLNIEEAIRDLKVKSVTLDGLGDAIET